MARIDLSFTGRISGGKYFLAGVWLFAIKFLIDHLLAAIVFHRNWTPIDYIAPGLNFPALLYSSENRIFYATMMLAALPFTFMGLVLTVQRLRSAGLPRRLVFLFFIPIVNVLYFILLTLFPTADEAAPAQVLPAVEDKESGVRAHATGVQPIPLEYGRDDVAREGVASLFPENTGASALLAVFLPIPIVAGLVLLATGVLRGYGFGLFMGMPFLLGWLSVVLHGMRKRRTFGQSMAVALASFTVSSVALLMFGIEGAGCLLMLLPLALPILLIGALMGYVCQKPDLPLQSRTWMLGIMLLTLPVLMGAEQISPLPAPLLEVISSVEIDAPPEVVWRHVIDFPPLQTPGEWIFRAGVAYPMRATIDGGGPGAIRRCVFSTGTFVEPIEVWDAPRLLKFSVTSNPPPMQEWSPYHIHPPHLQNFLLSEAGQFRLIRLSNGHTRLEGTTWYRHNMWPAAYWQLWSDYLIHRIHLRVLDHVKQLSETDFRLDSAITLPQAAPAKEL